MPVESPDDWVIAVRYHDQKGRDRFREVCVAPGFRTQRAWHATDEQTAIDAALRHLIWGVADMSYGGRRHRYKVRLYYVPDAVISVTPRRC